MSHVEVFPQVYKNFLFEKNEAPKPMKWAIKTPRIFSYKSGNEVALKKYKALVQKKIEEEKIFPLDENRTIKRRKAIKIKVRFTINDKGFLLEKNIVESSRIRLFDEAALASIDRASPFPVFLKDMDMKKVTMEVVLNYN